LEPKAAADKLREVAKNIEKKIEDCGEKVRKEDAPTKKDDTKNDLFKEAVAKTEDKDKEMKDKERSKGKGAKKEIHLFNLNEKHREHENSGQNNRYLGSWAQRCNGRKGS